MTRAISVSQSTCDELVAAGIERERIEVVPNGLDHEVHHRTGMGKDPEPLVVVLGRLKAYKRVDVAIRALARVRETIPRARMVVIGCGVDRPRLEGIAADLKQPVTFLGNVRDADKVRWLNRAHVVLCCSEKEGFGLVALEAMACGTPNVVSDVPGHRDAVPEGVGIRVPVRDPEAMADAAVRVLRGAFERRGRRFAAGFSWDRTAEVLERVALEVAGEVSSVKSRGARSRIPATPTAILR